MIKQKEDDANAGVQQHGDAPVSVNGIDEKTGLVDVYALLPEQGDSLMIVNCGDHFEMRHHRWSMSGQKPPLMLTEQDIERLRQGAITWN